MTKPPELDSEARPLDITQAINAVMSKVGYVQKQKAKELNYTYAGEAALIAAIRPWLVEYGIVIYPSGVSDLRVETYTTSKGSVMNHTVGLFKFTFAHAESGTTLEVQVLGEGADTGDKSANKAMTGALKYAWRQTFGIETGDDPDKFSSEDQERSGNGKPGNVNVPHWSTNPKNVEKFESWCERGEITQNDMFACFGSMDIKDFPLTLRETEETLARFVAQGGG